MENVKRRYNFCKEGVVLLFWLALKSEEFANRHLLSKD